MSISLILVPIAIAAFAAAAGDQAGKAGDPPASLRLGTRMKSERLLRATLEDYGCRYVTAGGRVDSTVEDARIFFERDETDAFDAVFVGGISGEHARAFLSELEQGYAQLLQQQVYENLLARAHERGLVLESEEVREDNSVLLSFQVEEDVQR